MMAKYLRHWWRTEETEGSGAAHRHVEDESTQTSCDPLQKHTEKIRGKTIEHSRCTTLWSCNYPNKSIYEYEICACNTRQQPALCYRQLRNKAEWEGERRTGTLRMYKGTTGGKNGTANGGRQELHAAANFARRKAQTAARILLAIAMSSCLMQHVESQVNTVVNAPLVISLVADDPDNLDGQNALPSFQKLKQIILAKLQNSFCFSDIGLLLIKSQGYIPI